MKNSAILSVFRRIKSNENRVTDNKLQFQISCYLIRFTNLTPLNTQGHLGPLDASLTA